MLVLMFGAGFLSGVAVCLVWWLSVSANAREGSWEIRENLDACNRIVESMNERLAESRAKSVETRKFINEIKSRQKSNHQRPKV